MFLNGSQFMLWCFFSGISLIILFHIADDQQNNVPIEADSDELEVETQNLIINISTSLKQLLNRNELKFKRLLEAERKVTAETIADN